MRTALHTSALPAIYRWKAAPVALHMRLTSRDKTHKSLKEVFHGFGM
ncbi:hypothetical protein HCU64_02825 [Methylobacterium sp. C25]|nr:hypothetical protein [Methylobacterium sp. C25]MCE4222673.1 hypothetical protein [Methylobacterium sp. C25]